MAEGMTPAEAELLANRGDMWGGGGAFFWIFALLILAGGNFGFGGNARGDYVTSSELNAQLNGQALQGQVQALGVQVANQNYETAQLINGQTTALMMQNNTDLINAIQGFNQLGQKLDQLGYHLDRCCCEIKTQMLQNRLDDANAVIVAQQGVITNANQSQYLLGQLGRFVAWTPSGTQAAAGG